MAFGSLPNTLGGGGQASGAYLPGGGVITGSSGAITLTAGGTAQNITLTPSGTGTVDIFSSNDASFGNVLRVLTPTLSSGNSALILLGKAGAANQSAFINYLYNATASNTRLDFGHNGTTGQVSLMQTGRFLIGTGGVDSGALLQVGTNTITAAGGMVFGTDTFLFRRGAYALQLEGVGSNTSFILSQNGVLKAGFTSFGTNLFVDTIAAGDQIVFRSGAQTTALTLDASQGATFAGLARLPAGTVGAPSLTFGDTDTGILSGGANALSIATNGVERLGIFDNGLNLKNVTAPSGTPSGGGYLYSEAGALKWKGSSGTVTTVAVA